jgi:hypothetical protein
MRQANTKEPGVHPYNSMKVYHEEIVCDNIDYICMA